MASLPTTTGQTLEVSPTPVAPKPMLTRFVRKQIEAVMNFTISKVLVWCVPFGIIIAAITLVLIFGDKDIVHSVLYLLCGGGCFVAGRASKSDP